MTSESDVIIIGGGIHGASLAFHLAQKGVKSLVLEKKFLAAGATGRSSGLVRMHYDLKLESQLAWISFRYFQDWHEIVGGESGPNFRKMDLEWVRELLGDCKFQEIAFFMKQDASLKPGLRGRIPDDLWIQQFPVVE